MPIEELTLKTASLTDVLDWLIQPQGPHLVDGTSAKNPLTASAILITPEALYDPWCDWASCTKPLTYRPHHGVKLTST